MQQMEAIRKEKLDELERQKQEAME